jgi:hypothetical protein
VTSAEAKSILIGVRSDGPTDSDPQLAEAMLQLKRDPELRDWFQAQKRFHSAVRASFSSIPVPAELRERILAGPKVIEIPWWRRPAMWTAAAAAVVLFAAIVITDQNPKVDDSLALFRSRMVRTVERQYRMDITTNDASAVRKFLATNAAPADYNLTTGLANMPVLGGGVLSWQGQRVSMVCFGGGKAGTLFLFVTDAAGVDQTLGKTAEFAQVNRLMTVSWTNSGKVYVLAANASEEELRRYL